MDGKKLVHDIFGMINSGDYSRVRDLIHEDYIDHGTPLGEVRGPKGFLELSRLFAAAFSDIHNEVDLLISEADMAAWRVIFTGVHTGELMGLPPTGKKISFQGYNFGRMQDGKAIEHWTLIDTAALIAQLGASAPAP